MLGPFVPAIADGTADAFEAFLHGGVGQADNGCVGLSTLSSDLKGEAARGDIHFDFAADGFDAGQKAF